MRPDSQAQRAAVLVWADDDPIECKGREESEQDLGGSLQTWPCVR